MIVQSYILKAEHYEIQKKNFHLSLRGVSSKSRVVWSVQLDAEVDKVHVSAVLGAAESQGVPSIQSEEHGAASHLVDVSWKYRRDSLPAIINKN